MVRRGFADVVNAAPQELPQRIRRVQIFHDALAHVLRAPAGRGIAQRGALQILVGENRRCHREVVNAAAGQRRSRLAAVNHPVRMFGVVRLVILFAVVVALRVYQISAFPRIVVTPADALVINTDEFRRAIAKALLMTDQSKAIVTIGIKPCRPETGYGYIAAGEEVDQDIRKVDEFKEKPDLKTAQQYVDAGNYFWNAGIFVWNVKTIEEAIRRYAPGIAEVFDRIYPEFYTEREKETIEELFPTCESISIDYAVMEKAERIYVLPAEFGWSDLGSWGSLHSLLPKDNRNNAIVGENIRLYECNNCIVHTPHLKQAVIQGLDGYIIAEKEGTLLICKLAEEQRIKEFSKA